MSRVPLLSTCVLSSLLGLSTLLTGCGGSGVALKLTTSGGKEMIIEMNDKGPIPGEDSHTQLMSAGFMANQDVKKIAYTFRFKSLKKIKPTKVAVADVTDEKPIEIMVDTDPKLDEQNVWLHFGALHEPEEHVLTWLHHEGNTIRVYRFQVEYADGFKSEVYQASMIPAFGKMVIKSQLGIK